MGLNRSHYGLEKPKEILCDFFSNLIWRYQQYDEEDSAVAGKTGSAFLFVGPSGSGQNLFGDLHRQESGHSLPKDVSGRYAGRGGSSGIRFYVRRVETGSHCPGLDQNGHHERYVHLGRGGQNREIRHCDPSRDPGPRAESSVSRQIHSEHRGYRSFQLPFYPHGQYPRDRPSTGGQSIARWCSSIATAWKKKLP